ncbi:MAG TPA: DUF92 domain-containing protein [Balneolaceae bacterium]
MDRKLNYLFSFLLIVVFIFAANAEQHRAIILGLILASVCSFTVFLLRQLTLDGMFAAIVVGTFVFGLGGLAAAFVILLFFVSSVILSNYWKAKSFHWGEARRDGRQVWANSFALVLSLVLAAFFNSELFLTGAMAALATATADTWATELGDQSRQSTYLITTFQNIEPGADGGVSRQGSAAALAGSVMIALAAAFVFPLYFFDFIFIFLSGVFGCFADSWLGAVFQQKNKKISFPFFQQKIKIGNNLVNSLSTASGTLLAIILKLIF